MDAFSEEIKKQKRIEELKREMVQPKTDINQPEGQPIPPKPSETKSQPDVKPIPQFEPKPNEPSSGPKPQVMSGEWKDCIISEAAKQEFIQLTSAAKELEGKLAFHSESPKFLKDPYLDQSKQIFKEINQRISQIANDETSVKDRVNSLSQIFNVFSHSI